MTNVLFLSAYLIAVACFLIWEWVKHKRLKRKIGIKIRAIRYAEKYRMLKKLMRG